jgi:hypothetical protein
MQNAFYKCRQQVASYSLNRVTPTLQASNGGDQASCLGATNVAPEDARALLRSGEAASLMPEVDRRFGEVLKWLRV